jgi:hypothetical protein
LSGRCFCCARLYRPHYILFYIISEDAAAPGRCRRCSWSRCRRSCSSSPCKGRTWTKQYIYIYIYIYISGRVLSIWLTTIVRIQTSEMDRDEKVRRIEEKERTKRKKRTRDGGAGHENVIHIYIYICNQVSTAGLVVRELKTLMGLPPSQPLVQSIISCVLYVY